MADTRILTISGDLLIQAKAKQAEADALDG
jgi:hypothetical protein